MINTVSACSHQGIAFSVSAQTSRPAARFYARNTAKLAGRFGVQAELRADGSRLNAAQQVHYSIESLSMDRTLF